MRREKTALLLMKQLLRGTGVLSLTNDRFKWIDKFWSLFWFCSGSLLFLSSLQFLLEVPLPLIEKLEALLYFTANVHIVSNHAILNVKRKSVKNLIDDIEILHSELYKNENNMAILDKWAKRGKRQSYFFISTYFVYTLGPFLVRLAQLLIFDYYQPPYSIGTMFIPKDFKVLSMLFQFYAMFCGTFNMSIHMSFICILGTSLAGGMEVLSKELKRRGTLDDNRDFHLFSYKVHSEIINLTARFNKLFGFSLAILTALCSIQCCVTTYPLARENVKMQDFVLFCTTNVFPVAICETGNAVFTESNNIFLATYDNYWYNENPKNRKELNIMMLAARKPLHLHFRHVVRFTYETYLSILQTAYSYMAVLRTMERS